ncbi:MAG: ABC transporter ATP-binding protein [Acidobacteria bacterium]|nr:MAG: ABC transporter ATP-binding protein [Acidobacteriota bacterium]REK07959.1 MAG: ABC transporter ATP-binding protein [Acidobacteriota bacterium]
MRNVSKFYGEVLGVNRVDLEIEPGITSLVGPNGSGKTTLMNLVSGLIRPSEGEISVLGIGPREPELLFREVGYCTQFDSFPRGVTGRQFIRGFLRLHGYAAPDVERMAEAALHKVDLVAAADRKVAGYSKGMRQRIKLAQAIAHDPKVLVLDEPLNGLDPMARAEIIGLFQEQARQGLHVLISSHILHEVDMISDRVILISNGYIVAEGEIRGVRSEVKEHDLQILVRCSDPKRVATAVFERDSATEVLMHDDGGGLHLRTRDPDRFYDLMSTLVLDEGLEIESVGPADDNVQAVYQYLVGNEGAST